MALTVVLLLTFDTGVVFSRGAVLEDAESGPARYAATCMMWFAAHKSPSPSCWVAKDGAEGGSKRGLDVLEKTQEREDDDQWGNGAEKVNVPELCNVRHNCFPPVSLSRCQIIYRQARHADTHSQRKLGAEEKEKEREDDGAALWFWSGAMVLVAVCAFCAGRWCMGRKVVGKDK